MNVTARLTEKVESDKNISGRFLPLKIEGGRAIPVISENKGIVNLAKADGYIILDEETATIEEGCAVFVNLF
jgi:molybdopterin biosynthesis enzyme